MIQHHAKDLLLPALRVSAAAHLLDKLEGLVAPSFLLTAGFALGLNQVRAGGDLVRARKTFWRTLEVLLAATFVNWLWFPLFREPRWIGRVDILHCVGLSLLLLLPVLVLLGRHPRALTALVIGLGLACFVGAPFAERVTGPFAQLFNVQSGAAFPLLPLMGHAAFGVALGAAAAHSREQLSGALLFLVGLCALIWIARPLWFAWLPAHDFEVTDPSVHCDRATQICVLLLALLAVERRFPDSLGPRPIAFFANRSLSAYVFHEALLYYGGLGFSFMWYWGHRCTWPAYWGLTLVLILGTAELCRIWDALDPWARATAPKIQRAPLSRDVISSAFQRAEAWTLSRSTS